jgi:hypothetical protein
MVACIEASVVQGYIVISTGAISYVFSPEVVSHAKIYPGRNSEAISLSVSQT